MRKLILLSAALLLIFTSCGEDKQEVFNSISKEVKSEFAPDRRDKTFETKLKEVDGKWVLYGSTTEAEAKAALLEKLAAKKIDVLDSMKVLPDAALVNEGKIYAVVSHSVANLRYEADYSSEMATQVLMGTPLKVLEKKSYWYRVVTPEGYIAWVTVGSVKTMNEEELTAWRGSERVIVDVHYTLFRDKPSKNGAIVSDGVWGDIAQVSSKKVVNGYQEVKLPNGKTAYVPASDVKCLKKWLDSRNPTTDNILNTGKQFLGFPYLWAGTSIKGLDCSGFVKTSHFLNGIILRRDASQQAKVGEEIDITNGIENLKKGDILFFGRKATADRPARVTHVGMYLGDGMFIHSATFVKINSLVPGTDNYYDGTMVCARRINGMQDTIYGMWSIAKHPWYFNVENK
ncbi:MAG: C40 family peptidase [Bacteroidales bacterium]|nr:C40 family peptidase [Bacteroidales bacterium]